jgi:hypothetical protein
MKSTLMASALVLTLAPVASFAATNFASGYNPNGAWVAASVAAGASQRAQFAFGVHAGKSYCAETQAGDYATQDGDSILFMFHGPSNAGTLFGTSDNTVSEPDASFLSRVCFVATATETVTAQIQNVNTAQAQVYLFRAMETTIYAPYFLVGSGYEGFLLLKNTTSTATSVTITLKDVAGATIGSPVSASVPADGSLNYALSTAPFSVPGTTAGTVQVAVVGAPGAIIGSLTSISFTGGVSFDVALARRLD